MKQNARIAVVDPFPIWNVGVAQVLQDAPGLTLIGSGGTATEAVSFARDASPDLILLELSIEGGGARAARQIVERAPSTRVAIFTASERKEDLMAAMAAGAHGYILKTVSGLELARSLRAILAGERYITPYFAARMLATIGVSPRSREERSGRESLTHREGQILSEAAKGKTNKEIAHVLKLSEKTIKYYMTNVLQKLQVRNRVEAINIYRDHSNGESL